MKLVGSDIERKYRSELENSKTALLSGLSNERLLTSIRQTYPEMKSVYVLDWVPEQGEDIFTVLVNYDDIAIFELPRTTNEPAALIKVQSVADYSRGLSKHRAIKLEVALKLLSRGCSYSP